MAIRIIGGGKWNADAGAPGWVANSLRMGIAAAVTRNGAGDYTFTFDAATVCDATESIIMIQPIEAGVASGLTSCHVIRPADNTFRVTTLQEAAGGLASVLTDVDFSIVVLKIENR